MATAPHVIDSGGGSIILVSSAGGLKAMPFMIPYTASKFAVTGLAKAFAKELADDGVRVNSLHPGGVDTVMAGGESDAGELFAAHPRLAGSFANVLPISLLPRRRDQPRRSVPRLRRVALRDRIGARRGRGTSSM